MTDPAAAAQTGEERLILRYFRPLANHPGAFGLQDDAGVLTPPTGCDVVLKTDPIICGVHFFAADPPEAVARKALRVNLSDLAAKGAKPAGFLLALALPATVQEDWLAAFARALGEEAESYQCPLLGGDTDRTPGPLTVSIAAFGTVAHGRMVRRSGARPGDRIVVSGTIGDAALGVRLRLDPPDSQPWAQLSSEQQHYLRARYLLPEPRIGLAPLLQAHASAAMDISDGLVGDLGKLCRASAVSAEVEISKVPLSAAVGAALRVDPGLLSTVLTGGDDYEILCTLEAKQVAAFCSAASQAGIATAMIGEIVSGSEPPRFCDDTGQPMRFTRTAYTHF